MSGRADFYVLPAGEERNLFACRLIEKAYKLGNSVWLRLDHTEVAAMDEYLWTFRPESFVPHSVYTAGKDLNTAAVWLMTELPEGSCGMLVNLALSSLDPPTGAGRVVELVNQDAQILQLTRSQYSRYKALGWTINTHKL